MNDKKIVDFFTNKVVKDEGFSKYSFRNGMKYTITSVFEKVIVPWMKQCLIKYPVHVFHERMNEGSYEFDGKRYVGFDFLYDWENNHEDKIRVLKRSTRIVQKYLDLDVDKILATIVDFMNDNGYEMTPSETLCIRHTIIKTQRLIFQ